MKTYCTTIILLVSVFLFFSCSGMTDRKSFTVATWNVQTFFDGKKDGCEYSQFLKNDRWNKEIYIERLKRLAASVKKIDADVIVLEELENKKNLYDLYNFLAGEWDSSKVYRWACFAKEESGAIGCGVLSRFPLYNMSVHSADIQSENEGQPSLRPLICVDVKIKDSEVTLAVNHWKSMFGGEEVTEKWRNRQESILEAAVSRNLLCKKNVIALGDFNRDLENFRFDRNTDSVLLRQYKSLALSEEGTFVKTAWSHNGSLTEPGSYFYKEEWSRIDNIFYAGSLNLKNFEPVCGEWCDKKTSFPKAFKLFNLIFYLYHLTLKAEFSIIDKL